MYKYDPDKQYYGAIVGWTIETLKGNIVEVLEQHLKLLGLKPKKNYELRWNNDEKCLIIYNIKIFFFGFNNVKSFNKILGKPLILEWIDESARIYSQKQLQTTFDEFPGRQMSFAGHPYLKTIHSFNVEGSERHDYKIKYIDGKKNAIHYTFFPYDNPVLDTEEKMKAVVNMFAPGSLREQKVFNKWVVAEGKVFNIINVIKELNYQIREIVIGIDYGSVNPTTFVPVALCYDQVNQKWKMVRLGIYYHNPNEEKDTPTTEFYSMQLRLFLIYLNKKYPNVPISQLVLDSEASHFDNRLTVDAIEHSLTKKGPGSVNEGVEYMQSLFYKEYLEILDEPSIRYFLPNGEPIYSGKDEGLIELDSYQYDKIKSENTGVNCYKKDLDHSIDALRYALTLMKEYGLAPVV